MGDRGVLYSIDVDGARDEPDASRPLPQEPHHERADESASLQLLEG